MHRRSVLRTLAASGALALIGRRSVHAAGDSAVATRDGQPAPLDLDRLLRLAAVPSLALAMVDGSRVTTRVAGVRRAGEPTLTSADTVYAAASLTKPVVA